MPHPVSQGLRATLFGAAATAALALPAAADQVFADDVIIDGSLCVGFDCINGENFGFDTIRLKENNLRIHAEDTSAGTFPSNDWRIVFNDTTSGGQNKLSVVDVTGSTTPFTIEAGVRSHQLYVADNNRVGFGTSTPAVDLHVKQGNTPTLRLEQDGSSGFTAQTWDVAGNETNFFVRDTTNGSALPFRIRPGAPSSAIYIANNGNIGMGAGTDPNASLHVRRTDGTAQILVEETTGTAGARGLLEMRNNGVTFFTLADTSAGGETWNVQSNSGELRFTNATGAGIEMRMTTSGDMTISGALTQNSDKNAKMAIVPVDPEDILQKVTMLPVSSWTYKDNAALGIRHIGPMAQDFYAAFGTGASDTGISSLDTSGVALAAIQALASENAELKLRLSTLEEKLAD